ncbi:phosphomannomutase [Neorhizobium sp. NPDC001467]|uniref:phosphomannomutase n=1 Tax=Neorhizobium sp. NPDC001467 TaxID=3390595 RepID=UPI003D035008
MKFGTSGLRGLVSELQGHAAALYATAFARHMLEKGLVKPGDRIFVAGDYRPSTPDIAATCIGALSRAGLQPVDCGAIPTPALALYAMTQSCASLMITGSHIPADRNGIKFYRPDGEIDKADESAISGLAPVLDDAIVDLTPGSAPSEESEALALFLERNRRILPAGALSGLRIGVYQHSTVARDALVTIMAGYGAEVVALARSEQFIPVDTEAVSPQTIDLLRTWAREHGCDAIVSADGDGDRPLVTDETGQPLRGDLLGLMVARLLDAKVIVTPVTSNSGIEAVGDHEVIRTRVGSPFVIAGMAEADRRGDTAIVGFEANGGVLTQTDFVLSDTILSALPTRDSFLPILAALFLARQQDMSLSALASSFSLPCAAADRLENIPIANSTALMAHLRQAPANLSAFLAPIGEVASVSDIDGLRVTLADRSIVHLRPSGNAPEMRCYVEAADETSSLALLAAVLSRLQTWMNTHGQGALD